MQPFVKTHERLQQQYCIWHFQSSKGVFCSQTGLSDVSVSSFFARKQSQAADQHLQGSLRRQEQQMPQE
jgi:hypothetical protein